MKSQAFFSLFSAVLGVSVLIFSLISCDASKEAEQLPPRPCVEHTDCYTNEVCIDEYCEVCMCLEYGGYCEDLTTDCADGYFDWSSLGCPQGRDGKCCMPDNSCTAIGGYCLDWEGNCAEGYGAYGSLDCPNGRYDQCCVPIR